MVWPWRLGCRAGLRYRGRSTKLLQETMNKLNAKTAPIPNAGEPIVDAAQRIVALLGGGRMTLAEVARVASLTNARLPYHLSS